MPSSAHLKQASSPGQNLSRTRKHNTLDNFLRTKVTREKKKLSKMVMLQQDMELILHSIGIFTPVSRIRKTSQFYKQQQVTRQKIRFLHTPLRMSYEKLLVTYKYTWYYNSDTLSKQHRRLYSLISWQFKFGKMYIEAHWAFSCSQSLLDGNATVTPAIMTGCFKSNSHFSIYNVLSNFPEMDFDYLWAD